MSSPEERSVAKQASQSKPIKSQTGNKNEAESPLVFASPAQLATHFATAAKFKDVPGRDFYATVLQRIAASAAANDYVTARAELADELAAPYIPAAVEAVFVSMNQLLTAHEAEQTDAQLRTLSAANLIQRVVLDFPKHLSLFEYLLTKPADFFVADHLDYFRFIFSSSSIIVASKITALLLLNEISSFHQQTLTFLNTNTNERTTITLTGNELLSAAVDQYWKDVYHELNTYFDHDPSLQKLAANLVDEIAVYFWPQQPPHITSAQLAAGVCNYLHGALGQKKVAAKHESTPVDALITRVLSQRELA